MRKAGQAHLISNALEPWEQALSFGLTTFPEHGVESRSDCHAWSAHLLYDLPALIAGIGPAAPGFDKVIIKPQDASFSSYSTDVQHPNGMIQMVKKHSDSYRINLPEGLYGSFVKNGKTIPLRPGSNQINL